MKIGLILECTKNGPDQMVCEYLVGRLRPNTKVVSVTLGNKQKLIAGCGVTTAQLLSENCSRVVIVWDLYPPWRPRGERPCRREEREAIFSSLKKAGVTSPNVYLVCIREELETWLLADERAIASAIRKLTNRKPRITKVGNPEVDTYPKEKLKSIFRQHTGRPYQGHIHAIQIVRALPDCKKIKRCASFTRFALKAADKVL